MDKPLDELVELWLNSEHKHSMEVFYSSTGNFKKQLMALSIYREVLANIISKMIETDNYEANASAEILRRLADIQFQKDLFKNLWSDFSSDQHMGYKLLGMSESFKMNSSEFVKLKRADADYILRLYSEGKDVVR